MSSKTFVLFQNMDVCLNTCKFLKLKVGYYQFLKLKPNHNTFSDKSKPVFMFVLLLVHANGVQGGRPSGNDFYELKTFRHLL